MKEKNISSLVRTNIHKLVAYSSARSEFSGKADVFLDANENPFDSLLDYNRYPDTNYIPLRTSIAEDQGIEVNQLMLTNGSDEGIDIIVRAFCYPGIDSILTVHPGFGMFKVVADINDVDYRSFPLNPDFTLDQEGFLADIQPNTKLIFLCSPNNPTGSCISHEFISKLCQEFNGIIVIDEAYIEFSSTSSIVPMINHYNNLIITQTFSKAMGAAGIRLGKIIADPEILQFLNKIRMPYNISANTVEDALKLIKDHRFRRKMIDEILYEKELMQQNLNEYNNVNKVFPSEANFFLVRFNNPEATYRELLKKGVVVRNLSNKKGCEGCLRVSVGTKEQNKEFYKAMELLQ